ncbi:MAG: AAA family ATPase [Pseudomonadota bacterium]
MGSRSGGGDDGDGGAGLLASSVVPPVPVGLPAWFPAWACRLGELYFSGTTSVFVLHGNVFDFVRVDDGRPGAFGTLADFVADQLFGRWDLVLYHDVARGLRCTGGRNDERQRRMVTLANRRIGDLSLLAKDPAATLAALDRFVLWSSMAAEGERASAAIVFEHASYLFPRGDRLSAQESRQIVTMLNWATSPFVKRQNLAFLLVDGRLADVCERLVVNPHVASIEIGLPSESERVGFLESSVGSCQDKFSDYSLPELVKLTAGFALTDLQVLVKSSLETGRRLDGPRFRELKKRLIERQAQGLLEFMEPRWDLAMVVGHEAAKKRLREDAELVKRGALDSIPMGYLVCGPVGTGKSFLAQCMAGSSGIPCVKLKNFRSKFVGETEGNLERVLSLLRGMGPVVVIVDEADAMLGDREQGGDSGVGSRVFGMVAAQMGDTSYRGRIIWMLLTARPDLLPIDLKRQGRAEVHIPLFYPTDVEETRQFFVTLSRKLGAGLSPEDIPDLPLRGHLSGADIEGIIGRAWRATLLAGQQRIGRETLASVASGFMPSTQTLERELQELAAIVECTDWDFLPDQARRRIETLGGRERLQERLNALKAALAAG